MARRSPQEKLDDLVKKRDQLDARIQKEKAAVRQAERKRDTRRKIIAGALALEHASRDPAFGEALKRLIKEHAKPEDRALFNL